MNLFFRLLKTILLSRFRSRVAMLEVCRTPFWCLPTDLDVLRHMNNGKYFSLMDLGRVDLMYRTGMMDLVKQQGWYPVVEAETIRFKKSLKLFQRFYIETKVIGWDEKAVLLEQNFVCKDKVVTSAIIRGRFLKKSGGGVKTEKLLELMGLDIESPDLPQWVEDWSNQQIKILSQ